MKKKIVAIVASLAVLGTAATVFANYVFETQEMQQYEENTKFQVRELNENEDTRIKNMSEYIKANNDNCQLINDLIYDYAYVVQIYNKSTDEMNYIDSLIYGGADIEDIINIYKFWLTTNESIGIVGEIYNIKNEISDKFWIEEAFNQLTENKHGVLNSGQIKEYTNKGLGLPDIKTANILSRKGVYTINEILELKLKDMSWDEILCNIESSNQNAVDTAEVNESSIILSALDVSQKTRIPVCNYIINEFALEDLNDKSEKTDLECEREVNLKLRELAVLVDPVLSNEDNSAAANDIKNIIVDNGVSEAEIEQLINDGYMLMDILNASKEAKLKDTPINVILNDGRDN